MSLSNRPKPAMRSCFALAALLAVAGNTAIAQKGNSGANAVENGQPFQVLDQLIEENSQLISENAGAIADLELEVTALTSDLSELESDLDSLDARVTSNEDAIANAEIAISDAQSAILQNSADIDRLNQDLQSLASSVTRDIYRLRRDLVVLDRRVSRAVAVNASRISALNSQLYSLRRQVQTNTARINPLITDISILQNQVAYNSNRINFLLAQRNVMNSRIYSLQTAVAGINSEIGGLKNRVTRLESLHSDLYLGDILAGSLTASDNTTQAHPITSRNGAAYSDTYTFYLASTTTVTIELDSPTLGSSGSSGFFNPVPGFFDTFLILHEGDCNTCRIAYNDDGGAGLNARLSRTLDPGLYTIEVTSYGSGARGDYQLRVQ